MEENKGKYKIIKIQYNGQEKSITAIANEKNVNATDLRTRYLQAKQENPNINDEEIINGILTELPKVNKRIKIERNGKTTTLLQISKEENIDYFVLKSRYENEIMNGNEIDIEAIIEQVKNDKSEGIEEKLEKQEKIKETINPQEVDDTIKRLVEETNKLRQILDLLNSEYEAAKRAREEAEKQEKKLKETRDEVRKKVNGFLGLIK